MLETIYQSIVDGDARITAEGVQQGLDAGYGAEQLLNEAMIAAMSEVGRRYEISEIFVPEMLIAANAMKQGLAVLKPHLQEAEVESAGKVVLGTVQGDLHDIGKNLVGMMLEGNGFEVVDLGRDISPQAFVQALKEHQPQFVGLSALLTTTMPKMQATIEALTEAGLREQVVVMVGGAPLTQSYADEIGADLYAPHASSAVEKAKALVQQ